MAGRNLWVMLCLAMAGCALPPPAPAPNQEPDPPAAAVKEPTLAPTDAIDWIKANEPGWRLGAASESTYRINGAQYKSIKFTVDGRIELIVIALGDPAEAEADHTGQRKVMAGELLIYVVPIYYGEPAIAEVRQNPSEFQARNGIEPEDLAEFFALNEEARQAAQNGLADKILNRLDDMRHDSPFREVAPDSKSR